MRKLYAFLVPLFFLCMDAAAQYQVNGSASNTGTNQFTLIPSGAAHVSGSVFSTTQLNLTKNFEINAQLFFGVNDDGADGIGFVLQNEGPAYLGNSGAGLGYHRFDGVYPSDIGLDVPGPVPSFITEFDTYQNDFIGNQNIGDIPDDHLAFMSHSNAYHNSPFALSSQYPLANVEDGNWHDAKFSWNALTKTFTVLFQNNTYTYHGNMDSVTGGSMVYWGFTAGVGFALNEAKVQINSVIITDPVQPIVITGDVINNCTNGSINLTVTGGTGPYTYLWSNGKTTRNITNVAPASYTVTVKDAGNNTKSATFTVTGDNTAPQVSCPGDLSFCYNLFSLYLLPSITATDNCTANPTVTYTITGATTRSGSGKNASGYFDDGISNIVWKVKDANGNIATCTTHVVVNKVSISIPDAYAVNPGGDANTIYKGYGPTSLTLTANAIGGTPGYTYLWSTGATTKSITVSPSNPGLYAYLVLVTDSKGCSNLMIKLVRVEDVRCSNNKIEVCHDYGNYNNEVCVNKADVPAHLAHGDHLGDCNHFYNRSGSSQPVTELNSTIPDGVYPNPTKGKFNVKLSETMQGSAQVMIMNANGTVVDTRKVQLSSKGQNLQFDLTGKAAGIYLVKIISADGTTQTEKIIVQK